MQNLEELKMALPLSAKDTKINLENLLAHKENDVLSTKQKMGAALAAAYSLREKNLIHVFENEAAQHLSAQEINAAKVAANLMAMNNIYYRFTHLVQDKEYAQMPAGLRMQGLATHGIDKIDFEIYSLASSILNGCAICIDAHAAQLTKHGLGKQAVQMTAKIAAVINAAMQAI